MSLQTKVFLVCCGLGRTHRGFESFTQECHEALRDHPALDLTVFKGGGKPERKQVVLPCLPRTHALVERLGKAVGKTGYWLEQVSFALSLLPHVARGRPDVVCFMDCNVGNVLWHWRRLTKKRFGILLSNGGPLMPPFPRWEFVQQLTPMHQQLALDAGQDPDRQAVVPYGIQTGPRLERQAPEERDALRRTLGLPTDRPVLLSVGAVNATHKRMDYVIREVTALPLPHPYLVLLGQTDEETPTIRALADDLLGPNGYAIRTVPHSEVDRYYRSAAAFILASLGEGFGRVFLEALAAGLPCLAHDYAVTRYVLGEHGRLADFTRTGALTVLLCRLLDEGDTDEMREARHKHVYDNFSWQVLTPQYVALFERGKAL